MKLSKIDLNNIVAINHNQDKLGVLIDRGSQMEYLEIPAPVAAYQGLNQVANLANTPSSLALCEISRLESQTVSHALSTANQPVSVSYGAAIEVDEQKKTVRVEFTCELVYSFEESCDCEDEYDDFEDDFDCEDEYDDFDCEDHD